MLRQRHLQQVVVVENGASCRRPAPWWGTAHMLTTLCLRDPHGAFCVGACGASITPSDARQPPVFPDGVSPSLVPPPRSSFSAGYVPSAPSAPPGMAFPPAPPGAASGAPPASSPPSLVASVRWSSLIVSPSFMPWLVWGLCLFRGYRVRRSGLTPRQTRRLAHPLLPMHSLYHVRGGRPARRRAPPALVVSPGGCLLPAGPAPASSVPVHVVHLSRDDVIRPRHDQH